MHEQIDILDIEELDDGRFRVRFEVPGHHYNQNYPKRLSHCFPQQEKYFDDVELDTGETVPRYEKILRRLYLEDDTDDVSDKLDEERERQKDRTIEN